MSNRVTKFVFIAVLVFGETVFAADKTDLVPVDAVLARLSSPGDPAKKVSTPAGDFLREISAFREKSKTMEPNRAAAGWLVLWDKSSTLDRAAAQSDALAFDQVVVQPVGVASVIASLPGPASWSALRQQASARAAAKVDNVEALGLRLLTELLVRDMAAVQKSLAAFDRLNAGASPAEQDGRKRALERARALIYKLYGTREENAELFLTSLDVTTRLGSRETVDVPDLVGLVGSAKAEAMLRQALRKPILLQVSQGDATRALARKVALAELATLRKPQWALIDGLGNVGLYEAMKKKFSVGDGATEAADDEDISEGFGRRYADTYYFIDMVIAGRQADAERALARITGTSRELSIPKRIVQAIVKVGKGDALYSFLGPLLERRPQTQAWSVYFEQAASTGHAVEAIAFLDKTLKRTDLPAYLRADLSAKRLDALLGADQVEPAIAGFRELLAAPPARGEAALEKRTEAAIRLAKLGRVLARPELSEMGIVFAKQAFSLEAPRNYDWRDRLQTELLAELRREGSAGGAQAMVLAKLSRLGAMGGDSAFEALGGSSPKRGALVELAGIYDTAGRPADVLRLLKEASGWGARDVMDLLKDKDSLDVSMGMIAARAIAFGGDKPAALAVVRALLAKMPGYDAAYQMLLDLGGPQVIEELDRMYARDQFEERPLIWKAIALKRNGYLLEAEETVRRAIAIDPSDGDEGKNDRLRAYATLADILEAKGDAKAAADYRRAVAAIRQSEQADDLYYLGLFQRAFVGYRTALGQFADAYCIQSRLAVQLAKLGQQDEAMIHYRRAYELMPDSFGRVESHCFGCESVFDSSSAQNIAERVFTDMIKGNPKKAQAHYMLGYLRKEQGRADEAIGHFRKAVEIDDAYLNAWKHLHELVDSTYVESASRDATSLKLFALDPQQKHVRYQLTEIADFAALWKAYEKAPLVADSGSKPASALALTVSAKEMDQLVAQLPPEMRGQLEQYEAMKATLEDGEILHSMGQALASHKVVGAVLGLMGGQFMRSRHLQVE